MSSVGGIGAGNNQVFAQIDKLHQVVADASAKQIDFATKVAKLAVSGNVDAQKEVATTAALDKLV